MPKQQKKNKFSDSNKKKIINLKLRVLLSRVFDDINNIKYNYEIVENYHQHELDTLGPNLIDINKEILSVFIANKDSIENAISKYNSLKFGDVFLKDICYFKQDNNNYSLKIKNKELFEKNIKENQKLNKTNESIYVNCSTFVKNMFTTYESYCYKLFKIVIDKYPNKYLKDEIVSFNDLEKNKFNKEHIIENLIEEKSNHFTEDTDLKSICSKFKIEYDKFTDIKDDFIEIYYRRNALTHGDGQITKAYNSKVNKKYISKYTEKNTLSFKNEYIRFCYNTIIELILRIYFYSVFENDRCSPEDMDNIQIFVYDKFLKNSNWELCKNIYKYLRKVKYTEDCNYEDIFTVNYLLCLKNLNETEEFNKQLQLYNVSNKSKQFKLAKLLLQDKFNDVNKMLKSCYSIKRLDVETITAQDILTWPLFEGYRKSKEYEEFSNNHPDDFISYTKDMVMSNISEEK